MLRDVGFGVIRGLRHCPGGCPPQRTDIGGRERHVRCQKET